MLYYIHGYLSSPDGTKAMLFQESLNAYPIQYRTCEPKDLIVSECLCKIHEAIQDDADVMLIGSSLGGFLAAETALHQDSVKKIVLLNPALIPPDVDVSQLTDMPKRILKDMQDKELFYKKIQADILIILGTNDSVVPNTWCLTFAKVHEACVHFLHDDHQFSSNLMQLPELISAFFTKKH